MSRTFDAGGAPLTLPAPPALETDYYRTITDTAHILGWRVAHFRAGMNRRGKWATAVQGDGKGFPDFVLVHAGAGRVWFVEVKVGNRPLSDEQKTWGESLLRAGAVYRTVRCPHQLPEFLQDMADSVRPQ